MTRFELQGERDGRSNYAKCYNVFAPGGRVIRKMNDAERADYDRGYSRGQSTIDGHRLHQLGYSND